ncbi:Nucleotidyl transferase AbiEii toxin, Type IV TA system [Prauserella aidingensis]|nr:nucleotidyl transferase AbiEii/AbiGii toxin family protein [Prauserella aidingensis]MCP2253641.1 Nucleotidyl transferase AbiEii toxin, Type IV TA system [Prauserella aidingensis]
MRYSTGPAFRRALEDRLKARADGDGGRITRDRKRLAFDRFLARLVEVADAEWALKGGFALDLRLNDRARSTKDVDLACWVDGEDLLEVLIDAAGEDRGDFFGFAVERSGDVPDRFGGAHRFRVTASLAGRPFEKFVVDVGRPDDIRHLEAAILTTPRVLGFADIAPVEVPVIPLAVHVAEKLHACTRVTTAAGRVAGPRTSLILPSSRRPSHSTPSSCCEPWRRSSRRAVRTTLYVLCLRRRNCGACRFASSPGPSGSTTISMRPTEP